jgi:hypothetical protein
VDEMMGDHGGQGTHPSEKGDKLKRDSEYLVN